MSGAYDDIISLPHHVSERHPHLAPNERAAQFSPFAALTGYDNAIKETARLTTEKAILGEDAKEELDRKLQSLTARLEMEPNVSVTFFKPDEKKDGGRYMTKAGRIQKINEEKRLLVVDGMQIPFDEIMNVTEKN